MQPPVLWQRETDAASAAAAAAAASAPSAGGVYDSDDRIADSWRHVKQVAREGAKEYDLIDLLQNTRREETYSFPIPGVRCGFVWVGSGQGAGAALVVSVACAACAVDESCGRGVRKQERGSAHTRIFTDPRQSTNQTFPPPPCAPLPSTRARSGPPSSAPSRRR